MFCIGIHDLHHSNQRTHIHKKKYIRLANIPDEYWWPLCVWTNLLALLSLWTTITDPGNTVYFWKFAQSILRLQIICILDRFGGRFSLWARYTHWYQSDGQIAMVFFIKYNMSNLKKKCDIPADLAAFCKNIHGLCMHPHIYKEYILCYPKLIRLVYGPDRPTCTPRNVWDLFYFFPGTCPNMKWNATITKLGWTTIFKMAAIEISGITFSPITQFLG